MAIALTMFVLGMLLGFVGAGGSGFIFAILTVLFGVPIHMALGTSARFKKCNGHDPNYSWGDLAD